MKILFVNTYSPTQVQWGVEIVLQNLMKELRKKGVDCSLISLSDTELITIEAVRFREKLMINLLLLPKLLHRAAGYDLIHFNAYNSFLAKFVKNKPCAVTLHGSSFGLHEIISKSMSRHRRAYSKHIIERMERMGARACDRVFAVSESVKHQAIKGYHVPSSKIDVIYNGVSLNPRRKSKRELRKELGFPQKVPLLLTVTRGDYTKGTDLLIETCNKMNRDFNAHLLVVGKVPKHMRRPWMHFANPRHEEIWKHYQASDIYLNTSRYEGFGLAMLEAMGYGTPPVSFKVGISPTAITNGRNGFLVENYKVAEYAEAVSKLLKNEKLRKRLGSSAASTVKKRFSASKMADEYICAYKKMLSKEQ
ncbi:hypothetical protein DRN67_00415 [Candidatus Micrarchaeota archaeon]|nr:MAG: hypothetical protein DRN67_00415 [Candidatus Micrarchaeota archaeon]